MRLNLSTRYIFAIGAIGAVVALSVVPASGRPVTGLGQNIEHALCFILLGLVAAYAMPSFTLAHLLIAGLIFTACVELAQIPLPSRHARLSDFIVDAIAICIGIMAARFIVGLRRTT